MKPLTPEGRDKVRKRETTLSLEQAGLPPDSPAGLLLARTRAALPITNEGGDPLFWGVDNELYQCWIEFLDPKDCSE